LSVVDARYDAYCVADATFYDTPMRFPAEKATTAGKAAFTISERPVPQGWRRGERGEWVMLTPERAELPAQGWKVHVSACLDNADELLRLTWDYCVERSLPFKYLAGPRVLFMRNIKYADRGGSGKLITIYPLDERQCESVLKELDEIVGGRPGPYILSDLRWNAGPLYVRYGGFTWRYLNTPGGGREPAIQAPDGTLVPDRRKPVFTVPPWVGVPDFLRPSLAARNTATFDHVPYVPEQALHFSNGGGVYLAGRETTGEKVVLKEARPHAGLASDRSDAVTRLRRERDILTQLKGVPGVPRYLGYFTVVDHEFLAEEFAEGRPLAAAVEARNPLILNAMSRQEARDYTAWALEVCRVVERTVAGIHARGIVVGDLHPANILVTDGGEVTLIDFEVAASQRENHRPSMGNPGFTSREPLRGFAVDRYALACLRLFMFLPLTPLFHRDAGKARLLAEEIRTCFPVPSAFLEEAVTTITAPAKASSGSAAGATAGPVCDGSSGSMARWEQWLSSWEDLRQSMVTAIVSAATPEREDRLFPGDVRQFITPEGGLGMAYGAAGVLYALSATGTDARPDHEEWFVRRAERLGNDMGPGFYEGLHGVAFALDHLGHQATAAQIIDRCLTANLDSVGLDLFAGLAGIGLTLVHLADRTGDPALDDAAALVARVAAGQLEASPGTPGQDATNQPRTGLLHGVCGCGLLFIRMFEHTEDTAYLDLAATAIERDLQACLTSAPGGWALREPGPRLYLADGIAGLGVVLDHYLTHREDDRFTTAVETIIRPLSAEYHAHSGLFTGRAGIIVFLARLPAVHATLNRHLRALGWHALGHHDEVAFPGDHLVRLSMDLATGNAGVLLALDTALRPRGATLPFLAPATLAASSDFRARTQ
jgi:tRNA A-37 threonylcarbamoyl transferase component Bud32